MLAGALAYGVELLLRSGNPLFFDAFDVSDADDDSALKIVAGVFGHCLEDDDFGIRQDRQLQAAAYGFFRPVRSVRRDQDTLIYGEPLGCRLYGQMLAVRIKVYAL